MSKIGPTFAAELGALAKLSISWRCDTGEIFYGADVTPDQCAAVVKVLAAHNPAALAPVTVAPEQTLARFLTQKFPDAPADVVALAAVPVVPPII